MTSRSIKCSGLYFCCGYCTAVFKYHSQKLIHENRKHREEIERPFPLSELPSVVAKKGEDMFEYFENGVPERSDSSSESNDDEKLNDRPWNSLTSSPNKIVHSGRKDLNGNTEGKDDSGETLDKTIMYSADLKIPKRNQNELTRFSKIPYVVQTQMDGHSEGSLTPSRIEKAKEMFRRTSDHIYECLVCKEQFRKASKTETHVRKNHFGERRHRCEFCNGTFYSMDARKLHEMKAHGI